MKNQGLDFNYKISDLIKIITKNFENIFLNKYQAPTVQAVRNKQAIKVKDYLFTGKIEDGYITALKEFFDKENSNSEDRLGLLKQESPIYHILESDTNNNRFNYFNIFLSQLKNNDTNSKEILKKVEEDGWFNGFNLYSLVETLYYFTEIQKIQKNNEISTEIEKNNKISEEYFVNTLVNTLVDNFKNKFGEKIETALGDTITSISTIPSDVGNVFYLLEQTSSTNIDPLIISQLQEVKKAFDKSTETLEGKIEDLIGSDCGALTNLFNHFGINTEYFKLVEKELKNQIKKYTESLKKDVERQIEEKSFFIKQISNQYLSAYNSATKNNKQNIDSKVVCDVSDNLKLQEEIKNNLPLWIREGITELTYLEIDGENVGFIFNKAQKAIIEAIINNKKSHLKNVVTANFYAGTGGGKTHLINLLAGINGYIIGSNRKKYNSNQIKGAIFGERNVEIRAINFDSFYKTTNKPQVISLLQVVSRIEPELKTDYEIMSWISNFFQNIKSNKGLILVIALDEYHKFPPRAKKYLKERAKLFADSNESKVFFIKSTATPEPPENLYKSLKQETKKPIEIDNIAKIKKLQEALKNNNNFQQKLVYDKKYHIIVDPRIAEDDKNIITYGRGKATENKITIIQKKIDGQSFYFVFKGKELQLNSSNNVIKQYLDPDQLSGFLQQNYKLPKTLIYLYSTSAGGDTPIKDFSNNTEITIKITKEMKEKYSATEMVDYIIQALGRDRSFNWNDVDSFKNVEFDGMNKEEFAKILEKAQYFYSIKDTIKKRGTLDKEKICEKDIGNLIEYVCLKLCKLDSEKFRAVDVAIKMMKLIQMSDKGDCTVIYENIKEYSKTIRDNENKSDATFAVSLLLNAIIKYLEDDKTKIDAIKNKEAKFFIEKFKGFYEDNKVGKIVQLAMEGKAIDYIKNIISEIVTQAGAQGIQTDDIEVSNMELIFEIQDNLDQKKIFFDMHFCFKIIASSRNYNMPEFLQSLDGAKGENGKLSFNKLLSLKSNKSSKQNYENLGDIIEISQDLFDIYSNKKTSVNDAISLEAEAILHLFNKVLENKDNKFTQDNQKLINGFFKENVVQGSGGDQTKTLENNVKLEIIKKALSQRNKYDASNNVINDRQNHADDRAKGWRAGDAYKSLKTTLQTLNKKNIKFTTESLKLFNDGDKTLGTRKEVDNLIEKKALFMRAMRSADINDFVSIKKDSLGVNKPSNNILLAKPDGVAPKSIRVKLMELKSEINKQ